MKPDFGLHGKVALITGGSRGLGRAIAEGFASAGADIAVVSRKIDACEAAAAELRKQGVRAKVYACHVGRWDQIEASALAQFEQAICQQRR